MANKRVSELVQITAAELSPADLLLLADVAPNPESKKLTLTDLSTYLLSGGNLSGSLQGTASWAEKAVSASWAPPQTSASYASIAALAYLANTASHALYALSASWSRSGSYAITASYALTSSVQLIYSSAFADYARSASYLIYSPLLGNGTASYAMLALTASYALNSGVAGVSSSYSFTSSHALFARSSSFLIYTGVANGTASFGISGSWVRSGSYARSASQAIWADFASVGITTNIQESASFASSSMTASLAYVALAATRSISASYVTPDPNIVMYGIFPAITQSITSSQIDVVHVRAGTRLTASVDATITAIVPWTSSVATSESITLVLQNRTTGVQNHLDMTPVYIFNGGAGTESGSVKVQCTLMGFCVIPSDYYRVYLTASSDNITFDPVRLGKFGININVGSYTTYVGVPLNLYTDYPDTLDFTSSGVAYTDTAENIVSSYGSDTVTLLDASSINGQIYNVWTLENCTVFQVYDNSLLTGIGGMPAALETMSIVTASLTRLESLDHTSLGIFVVRNVGINSLPLLPTSMSYMDVSNNPLTTLPTIPAGLTHLYCDNLSISTVPLTLPDTITTMSFSGNSSLIAAWLSTLPTALGEFKCRDNPTLTSLPTIPAYVQYLDVSNDNLTDIVQDTICANLVTNGLNNGYLDLTGNQSLLPVTLTRITTLLSRGWTVNY